MNDHGLPVRPPAALLPVALSFFLTGPACDPVRDGEVAADLSDQEWVDLSWSGLSVPEGRFVNYDANAEALGCNDMELTIMEYDERFEGLYYLMMNLPAPFFEGRTYGPGTPVFLELEYWVSDGEIRIEDVFWTEYAARTLMNMTLSFDVSLQTGYFDWYLVGETSGKLSGTATFSYFYYDTERCTPPDLVAGPPITTSKDTGASGPGLDETEIQAYSFAHPGLEGTRFDATITHRRAAGAFVNQLVSLAVEPDPDTTANCLCAVENVTTSVIDPLCPVRPAERIEFLSGSSWGTDPGDVALTFTDCYGIHPTWMISPLPDFAPVLTAPAGGGTYTETDAIQVRWTPALEADRLVTLRLELDQGGEVVFEDVVPDTGEATISGADVAEASGDAWVIVERSTSIADRVDGFDLDPASTFTFRASDQVSIHLQVDDEPDIPDPDDPIEGWSEPQVLESQASGSVHFEEVAVSTDETGRISVAWRAHAGGEVTVDLRRLDPGATQWSERRSSPPAPFRNLAPLGLSASSSRTVAWTYLEQEDGVYPVLAVFEGEDPPRLESPAGFDTMTRETGIDGLATEQGYLLAIAGPDGTLQASVDGGSFQYLAGDGDVTSSVLVFPLEDGTVAIFHYALAGPTLYHWDPGVAGPGFEVPVSEEVLSAWCSPEGVAGSGDMVHVLCSPLRYGRYSLLTGDLQGAPETVTDSEQLLESLEAYQLAEGPDGVVWLLLSVACDYGTCPVLFQRTEPNVWRGPVFAAHARGIMRMAVDGDGRVHLVYYEPRFPDSLEGETLYHTRMELEEVEP